MIAIRLQQILIRLPTASTARWRSLLGQGGVILMGYIAIALLGMGALRLYTELAPKAVFGESNLLLTALTLGTQIFVAPFTNTQLRYHTAAQAAGKAGAFTREALVWALRGAAALAVLAVIGCLVSGRLGATALGPAAALPAFAWVFAFTVRNVLMSRLQAEQRRITYTGMMVVEMLAQAVFTVAALRVAPTIAAFVLGQVLAAMTLIGLILWIAVRSSPQREAGDVGPTGFRTHVASYGMAFAPLAVVGWLSNLADRYTLGLLLGSAAVGEYVAPLSIASRMMTMASGALNDLFRPLLFDAENHRRHSHANRLFGVWVAASAVTGAAAVLAIALAGKVAVGLLLGHGYREHAVPIMAWAASGYAVYGLTQIFETRMLSLGKSSWLVATMAAGAIANVAFSVVLISVHGVIGAAQANCLSFVVQAVITALFLVAALRRRARA